MVTKRGPLFYLKNANNNAYERDQMKKYLYVFFTFLACLLLSVRMSMHLVHPMMWHYGGILT